MSGYELKASIEATGSVSAFSDWDSDSGRITGLMIVSLSILAGICFVCYYMDKRHVRNLKDRQAARREERKSNQSYLLKKIAEKEIRKKAQK